VYFCTLCPSIGPKERSRQALDRLPLVSNFLTNFWMEHFDGACLSTNSVRNAIWHALNEPVCQYLRTRNPCCSTVYIDNSLGLLARDSSCVYIYIYTYTYRDQNSLAVYNGTTQKPLVILIFIIIRALNKDVRLCVLSCISGFSFDHSSHILKKKIQQFFYILRVM